MADNLLKIKRWSASAFLTKKQQHCRFSLVTKKAARCRYRKVAALVAPLCPSLILNYSFCLHSIMLLTSCWQHIEEVTGYILISRFRGHHIDFSSLRLIRGLELFKDPLKACKGTAEDAAEEANKLSESFLGGSKKYALFVRGNHYRYGNNLNELWMPNLTGNGVIKHFTSLNYRPFFVNFCTLYNLLFVPFRKIRKKKQQLKEKIDTQKKKV